MRTASRWEIACSHADAWLDLLAPATPEAALGALTTSPLCNAAVLAARTAMDLTVGAHQQAQHRDELRDVLALCAYLAPRGPDRPSLTQLAYQVATPAEYTGRTAAGRLQGRLTEAGHRPRAGPDPVDRLWWLRSSGGILQAWKQKIAATGGGDDLPILRGLGEAASFTAYVLDRTLLAEYGGRRPGSAVTIATPPPEAVIPAGTQAEIHQVHWAVDDEAADLASAPPAHYTVLLELDEVAAISAPAPYRFVLLPSEVLADSAHTQAQRAAGHLLEGDC
ncbi:hypothetical protein M8C13_07335 [Crossiella sp. SN42]|uniref:hypothetical protein n=1 Tax=Crossiella sp. SN42 TaxID=2944808 RepID=UPI00207C4A6F|nr:hypothetical protein [Crossiella sp. SN42]MCO1575570.1 hypothetical protein [Crossiella sp. SN42]